MTHTNTTRVSRAGFLAASAGLLLAACGRGSSAGPGAASPAPGTAPDGGSASTAPSAAVPANSVVPAPLVGASTIDGAGFDANTLAGRPTVAWFWAPWCVICRGEAPDVAAIAAQYGVAAGILFGAGAGIAVAAIAANASALVGYSIGRRLRNGTTPSDATGPLGRWNARLQANTFEAVLLTRLLFVPYDAVNYGCGVARVRPAPFVAATAIGTLPGTIAFVLVGASITRLDDGLGGLDRTTLAASAIIVVLSIIMSRVVRSRTAT